VLSPTGMSCPEYGMSWVRVVLLLSDVTMVFPDVFSCFPILESRLVRAAVAFLGRYLPIGKKFICNTEIAILVYFLYGVDLLN